MTNLALQLDFISEAFDSPDWLAEAMQSDPVSNNDLFGDLHTLYMQDGIIERDTEILCEYYDDIDDEYGTGIIKSWHHDIYIGEETIERAFIEVDGGGTTYARYEHIQPICEVNDSETHKHNALPVVQYPVATQAPETIWKFSYSELFKLPTVANVFAKVGAA